MSPEPQSPARRRRGYARGAIDNSLDPSRFNGGNAGALELASEIVRLLTAMDVRVGERIASERMLAERLSISRSAVREALKALALLGVVEVRRGSGTYLARPSSQILPQVVDWGLMLSDNSLFDLLDLREVIEPEVARRAAAIRTGEDLAALRALLARIADAGDLEARLVADVDFHLRLAAIPGNQALLTVAVTTLNLLRAWLRRLEAISQQIGDPQTPVSQHRSILEAIESGDPQAAHYAMLAHLVRSSEAIKQLAGHDQRVGGAER